MEFNPQSLIARIKERLASWRPMASEISHDYRDISADFRAFFRRSPRSSQMILWAALLLVGIALGASLKSVAREHITIGHGDYRLIPAERLYALNTLREEALERGAALPLGEKRLYPACSVTGSDLE